MLLSLLSVSQTSSAVIGTFLALILSFIAFSRFSFLLPRDHGRAYAVEGSISMGKATGGGLFFILVFCVSAFLFLPLRLDYLFYLLCICAAMLFGFLDDGAKKPWSEYLKGILDLLISLAVSLTYALSSSRIILLPILGISYDVPLPLYVVLGTVLVWIAINVTNCTDGVDGLSSSLTGVSILSFALLMLITGSTAPFMYSIFMMCAVLMSYLWFNTNPSRILMGDAGSRALGVFMAIIVMQSRVPLAYLPLCLVFILDGSSGILKISFKRFLRISIFKNTLTPFHDHLRKRLNWPNQQVTVRVTLLQTVISLLYLSAVYLMTVR